MEFSFINREGKIQPLELKIGDNWAEKAAGNEELNSIFSLVDNKNGIVEENEFNLLKKLLEKADTLIEKSANNKQITKEELQELVKQIENGTIDIDNTLLETFEEKGVQYYSKEALEQRYPSDKYEIVDEYEGALLYVNDKNSKKNVLFVRHKRGEVFVEKNEKLILKFDSNGQIKSFVDTKGRDRYPQDKEQDKASLKRAKERELDKEKEQVCINIANDIYTSISTKIFFGLIPTTGEDFLNNIKKITPDNAYMVNNHYFFDHDKVTLDNAIKDEWGLDDKTKKEALKHLESCLEKSFDYNRNFQNKNSQISNEFHKGQKYSVKQDGEKLLITNEENNRKYTLDLEMYTKNFDNMIETINIKKMLQELPGEILADISMELDSSLKTFNWLDYLQTSDSAIALYSPDDNEIRLSAFGGNSLSFVHELGHALDFFNIENDNKSSIRNNSKFMEAFNEEMNNYIKQGYKQYSESSELYNSNNRTTTEAGTSNYATANEKEMFAECYTLLMLGNCTSRNVIIEHFPKTLKEVEKHIEYIRSLPPDERA